MRKDFGTLFSNLHTGRYVAPDLIADNHRIAEDFRSLVSIRQRTSS